MTRGWVLRTVDVAVSKALRYDLNRTDALNWFRFARNLLLLLLVSVSSIAGLAGVAATRQARDLLEGSLLAQGQAVARSVARVAFVPLSLDDRMALATLLESYRGTPDLLAIRLTSRSHRPRASRAYVESPDEPGAIVVEMPVGVTPEEGARGNGAPTAVAGFVSISMSHATIQARSRRIALFNLFGAVGLALLVLLVATLLLRQAVERMRELVGEAKLAAALQQANAELETFSYSVSHDLRAPLRAVDGFSQILLEDYAGALDETGRGHLNRVRAGCQRMGTLIDDLLKLSRVIRQDMRPEYVDLGPIALAVVDLLRAGEPGRQVEVILPPRLLVRGDPGLLRSVLENLLGNAWKFTSKRPDARIEFGVEQQGKDRVYFVRDNGAGFDMAYSKKLFGAFQRLHAQEDYAGTGVGLATVQRIIVRHGGRIWADSSVGAGATFFFTLAPS